MIAEDYEQLIEDLTYYRNDISKTKRRDYTQESMDVLQNFKNGAEKFDLDPKQVLGVHLEKQISAVFTYIKTNGHSESEPIKNRISDCLNYLELLWGLIYEEEDNEEPLPF